MAKKRVSKKKSFRKDELVIEEMIDEGKDPYVPNRVEGNEDKQLLWMVIIILVVFALFLIPYFYLESKKSFEFEDISWGIEEHGDLTIYHGIFRAFMKENKTYNIYLRQDPRENEVSTFGEFNKFTEQGIISASPDLEKCTGKGVYRMIADLSGFLRGAIGLSSVAAATTSIEYSQDNNVPYANCTSFDQTTIVIQIGNESFVSQSSENPYCYTLQVTGCEDIAPIEKFLVAVHSAIYKQLGWKKA